MTRMAPLTRFTARLRLEPIGPTHVADLLELHRDPGIARWYGAAWTRADAVRETARFAAGWATHGVGKWIAYDRQSGELVGRGGCARKVLAGQERVEVGWAVREPLWGNGFATEIGQAGLDFAFGELAESEVVAVAESHNARSRAVMERLGMRYDRDVPGGILAPGLGAAYADVIFVVYTVAAPN